MVGRAMASIFWGIIADRYGRKPVIMIGITSVLVFVTSNYFILFVSILIDFIPCLSQDYIQHALRS